jgi:hypothetical protein
MAITEVQLSETVQQKLLAMDYPALFTQNFPVRVLAIIATARLGLALSQPLEHQQLEIWADRLQSFSPEELTAAFISAEESVEAWPTPAKIIQPILAKRMQADLDWILKHLKIHGIEWADKPEGRKPASYDPNDKRLWIPGDLIPAIPAPKIPERIRAAVTYLGHGDFTAGLKEMKFHPQLLRNELEPEEHGRQKDRVEKAFRAAWMQARFEA